MMLSMVTTLYQSAAFVDEFYRRASAAAASVTDDYEIVFVDDGSPDDSLDRAVALTVHDRRVVVIELSRNFGHHKAMMTGLEHARGDLLFLTDVDLEEDPAWVTRFRAAMTAGGFDVVYGVQDSRTGGWLKRFGGELHWWLIRRLSPVPIPKNLVTARLMTRQYVQALVLHKEQRTAIGGLWMITGFRQQGLLVAKADRGTTSYSFGKRLLTAFDGITGFSEKPLTFVFWLGLMIFAAAAAGGAYLVYRRLFGSPIGSGWASVVVSIWLLGGLSIAAIGVVGLYTARIFIETKHRPYSIIRGIHGRPAEPPSP